VQNENIVNRLKLHYQACSITSCNGACWKSIYLKKTTGCVIIQVCTANRTDGVLCGAWKADELSPPQCGVIAALERVCSGVINHEPLHDAFHTRII